MIGTPPVLLLLTSAADPPPKRPVAKGTTYSTAPLDKDGYVDYPTALNERLAQGVTPDTNAVVLIWQAVGPRPAGDRGMPPEYFKLLGVPETPADGRYFIPFRAFL